MSRLEEILRARNLSDRAFGELIGKSRPHARRLRKGESIPTLPDALKIVNLLGDGLTPADLCPNGEHNGS